MNNTMAEELVMYGDDPTAPARTCFDGSSDILPHGAR